MKIGLSSYSLSRAIARGDLGILEAIDWVANAGGEHIELVPGAWNSHTPGLVEKIVARAKEAGIDLSSYTIGANFIKPDAASRAQEVARIKAEVDIAGALGVKFMRYDAGSRPIAETSLENFEKDLPVVADCCREVAAYAAQYGGSLRELIAAAKQPPTTTVPSATTTTSTTVTAAKAISWRGILLTNSTLVNTFPESVGTT